MKYLIYSLSVASIAFALMSDIRVACADDRPNIVLLLADDLGYGDLSCFGSPAVKTPHVDRLANEGMKCNRFYAGSAVCSPTRASVLTGRYPLRFGITKHFNDRNQWLPESATTVAELLKHAFGHTNDLLPTFCDAAGVELPSDLPIDGLSLLPHLKGESPPSDDARGTVFWQLNLYKGLQRHYPKPKPYATEVAMRGKWKLLALAGKPVELFDIEADPNEKRNVMADHPDLVTSLSAEITKWLSEPRTTK